MKDYNNLTINEITDIFSAHLTCPDGDCGKCKLSNEKIGCFRLRDMAMRQAISILNEVK